MKATVFILTVILSFMSTGQAEVIATTDQAAEKITTADKLEIDRRLNSFDLGEGGHLSFCEENGVRFRLTRYSAFERFVLEKPVFDSKKQTYSYVEVSRKKDVSLRCLSEFNATLKSILTANSKPKLGCNASIAGYCNGEYGCWVSCPYW